MTFTVALPVTHTSGHSVRKVLRKDKPRSDSCHADYRGRAAHLARSNLAELTHNALRPEQQESGDLT